MEFFGYDIKKVRDKRIVDDIMGSGKSSGNAVLDSTMDRIFDGDFLKTIGLSKDESRRAQELVQKLRQDTNSRKDRYKEYKKACKDPVIGQAVEMMADDATQFDVDREKTVWVESSDKEYQKAINGIIADYIEPFIDTMASGIISKGEFAFKINHKEDGEDRGKYKDVVLIPYKHIEKLHHLILPNQERYYYEVDDINKLQQDKDIEKNFKDFEDFLHFINYSIDNSEEVVLKVPKGPNTTEAKAVPVFVLQGESIIAEKVLESYKILRALEDAIVSYRLAKSKLIRFVNVDVTRLADDAKVQNIVNYVHSALATNEAIGGTEYEESASQAAPVVVTVPVKNGVGTITVQEFNSDVNISEIADLNYFMNKIFAGLRTPRSYFNFDEALPGMGGSGASLAKMDIRYARAVKKVQRVLVNGVKDLIRVFNEINGIDPETAPEIKVKIVKVASAEDYDRYTEYEQRLAMASQVMQNLVDPATGELMANMVTMYQKFFIHVVPSPEMIVFLDSLKSKTDIKAKPADVKLNGVMKDE
jgi:hypothetical protein